FISSVQKEFSDERIALRDYITGDPLMRKFFEPFIFEDIPAKDRPADNVYIDEVKNCDIYLGLFGNEYGFEDKYGISPTHKEFICATEHKKHRLIFIKGNDDKDKHSKMKALIKKAGMQLVRRRFQSSSDLIGSVYASLIEYLEDCDLIHSCPFDAATCRNASLNDISEDKIKWFITHSRKARNFALSESSDITDALTHLNLVSENNSLSNAAVLLFGKNPQKFLISSEIKCAHFHGTEIRKPIPSYQVYKGTVFDLVDQAVDFVMSKINISVGTRKDGPQAPVEYEIPQEVVAEAIVNAVAHRDYTSNGSVQVMLFADRLEIWNPGNLPPTLTLEKLRLPHGSVPANPLIAEPLYLTKYIERLGTGTRDMISRCRDRGLPEPEFALTDGFVTIIRRMTEQVTEQVTVQVPREVERLIRIVNVEMKRVEIQKLLQLRHEDYFRQEYLVPALNSGFIEMTEPDKPTSKNQKYRLSSKGKIYLNKSFKSDKTGQDSAYLTGEVSGVDNGVVAGQVTDEVMQLLKVIVGELPRIKIQNILKLKSRANFEDRYLKPAIENGLIEMTIPDKPKSSRQKYRLTKKGKNYLKNASKL
ncbi:DUF4062 domain-containing protein, partial [Candidatus Dependentiae bacterium]|nr:DUF4062 domain-containing protein [Candidatus Dependentiae bacterium]